MPGPGGAGGGGFAGGSLIPEISNSNVPFLSLADSFVSNILDTFEGLIDFLSSPVGVILESYNNIFADAVNMMLNTLNLANVSMLGLMFGSSITIAIVISLLRFFMLR